MKLNKKELEEIKDEITQKKVYRRKLIEECDNYWKDISALERVYKINKEEDKLDFNGYLKKEEVSKRKENYKEYSKLSNKMTWILGEMLNWYKKDDYKARTTDTYRYDGGITLWNEEEVKEFINLLDMLGFTTLEYANNSSIALENIHYITKNSSFKLVDSSIKEDDNWGKPVLIFKRDLEQEKLEQKEKEVK